MTSRVVLHVGTPKSGTTYLQRVLAANRDRLADAGVLVAGERHVDLVHAGMVVREDPRLERLPERAAGAWRRVVDEVRAFDGELAVVSYELLAGATAEQAARARADLDGLDVHVVVTARDLGLALPSAWQERLKFALTTPLERWQPPPDTAVRSEWGWRTLDPAGVAARWGEGMPPGHVHVVTAPRGGDRTELWRRFARACGIDVPGLELAPEGVNESLGLVEAELLRRVNEEVGPPIEGNREHARWLRDTLAHGVLAGLGEEPIGVTDAQHAEAAARADACIEALASGGYDVVGDLEDLRATRRDARTPGQAADDELLAAAVRTVVGLLLRLRETSRAAEEASASAPASRTQGRGDGEQARLGPVGAARGVVRRALTRRVEGDLEDARRRIAALERQLREARAMQVRLAQLTDVVNELLLPAAERREDVLAAAERYRRETL